MQGWRRFYYNKPDPEGTPSLIRTDAEIDFAWGVDAPLPGTIDENQFSVQWLRTLELPAGAYRFRMTVDEGGRLYVNINSLGLGRNGGRVCGDVQIQP